MWKFCKRFNHFYVILSQVEIRYTHAIWGTTGIISPRFLPHVPSSSAQGRESRQLCFASTLSQLLHFYSILITRKKQTNRETDLHPIQSLTISCSPGTLRGGTRVGLGSSFKSSNVFGDVTPGDTVISSLIPVCSRRPELLHHVNIHLWSLYSHQVKAE